MSRRSKISAYAVAAAYSILLVAFNIQVPSLLSRLAGMLPLAVVAVFALFDRWLWRIGPFPRLAKRPEVRGTWFGELTSSWRDENDVKRSDTREVAIVIRQDFTTVSVTLFSSEGKSLSSAAEIVQIQSADYVLAYQYRNTPLMQHRRRSPIHDGGATIGIAGHRPGKLTGEYWTARDSRGVFSVGLVGRTIAGSYDESKAMAGR